MKTLLQKPEKPRLYWPPHKGEIDARWGVDVSISAPQPSNSTFTSGYRFANSYPNFQ
jgi:hypothetical protein